MLRAIAVVKLVTAVNDAVDLILAREVEVYYVHDETELPKMIRKLFKSKLNHKTYLNKL